MEREKKAPDSERCSGMSSEGYVFQNVFGILKGQSYRNTAGALTDPTQESHIDMACKGGIRARHSGTSHRHGIHTV